MLLSYCEYGTLLQLLKKHTVGMSLKLEMVVDVSAALECVNFDINVGTLLTRSITQRRTTTDLKACRHG